VDVNDFLDSIIKKDDIVLIMGAGDITRVSEELLKV
jgi:UDP-N-acetylmuramate-alanine ligase